MDDTILKLIRQQMGDDKVELTKQQKIIKTISMVVDMRTIIQKIDNEIEQVFADGEITVEDVPVIINILVNILNLTLKIKQSNKSDFKYVALYLLIDYKNRFLPDENIDTVITSFLNIWELVEFQFKITSCC